MSDPSATAAHRRARTILSKPRTTLLVALAAAAVVGCSGGGGSSSSSGAVTLAPSATTAAGAATLPSKVDAGTGALALGARLVRFAVTNCSLKPIIDADGVALVVKVTGDDGQGGVVDVSRKTTAGGQSLPTTTDTITYTAGGGLALAQRFEIGTTVRDVRDPAEKSPLLTIDGTTVRASGLFGGQGAVAGAADLVRGELLVNCTQDALLPPVESTDSASS